MRTLYQSLLVKNTNNGEKTFFDMSILTQYQINFFTKEIYGRKYKGMSSSNKLLDDFICDFETSIDVKDMIDELSDIINGIHSPLIYSTESMATINVNSTSAKLYGTPDFSLGRPFFELPTSDLKQIAIEWKTYLENS